MEAAGVALGSVSAGALFKTVLEAWEFVDAAAATAINLAYARTRLDNQRLIFLDWAERFGFFRPEGHDNSLLHPERRKRQIANTFELLAQLLSQTDALVDKYGFCLFSVGNDKDLSSEKKSASFRGKFVRLKEVVERRSSGLLSSSFSSRISASQDSTSVWKKTRWSVKDEKKCSDFLSKITALVDDLKKITEDIAISSNDTKWVFEAVEELDEESLRAVEEIGSDEPSIVSDVASLRIEALTIASTCDTQTYVTAKSTLSSDPPEDQALSSMAVGLTDLVYWPLDLIDQRYQEEELFDFARPLSDSSSDAGVESDQTWIELHHLQTLAEFDRAEKLVSLTVREAAYRSHARLPETSYQSKDEASFYIFSCIISDHSNKFLATVSGPKSTPFEGGTFHIRVDLPTNQQETTSVWFHTKVFHPNIDYDGTICLDNLNIMDKGVSDHTTILRNVIHGCFSLLSRPRWDDASAHKGRTMTRQEFDVRAKAWTSEYATGIGSLPTCLTRNSRC